MSRSTLLASLLAGSLLAACADSLQSPNAPESPGLAGQLPQASHAICLSDTEILALIDDVFADGSPDENAAIGKFNNVAFHMSRGEDATAQDKVYDLVGFLVKKHREGALAQSDPAKLIELINGLFCFVGLDITITNLDFFILFPSDDVVTFVTGDGNAGAQFPPSVVSVPTVVTVTQLPVDPNTPSPLITKLDQYPFFYSFQKFPDLPFTLEPGEELIVGICPGPGATDPDLLSRLVLGHQQLPGDAAAFELLPKVDVPFLTCPDPQPAPASSALGRLVQRVTAWFSPEPLHARAFFVGGVGGTAGEFSPFGPIDPELTALGGVGGTAGEFAPGVEFVTGAGTGCLPGGLVEAPVGSPVEAGCRPEVTVRTAQGTLLEDVPVSFAVETGGGSVAVEGPAPAQACGPFASTVLASTSAAGVARSCWTLGTTAGTNTVVATAQNGGDAIPGTNFVYNGDPTSTGGIRFTATANPPARLAFTTQPAADEQVAAGTTIPLVVEIQDRNGVRVQIATEQVDLSLNQNSFAAGSVTSMAAAAGVATFSGLSIETAAPGYMITAAATLDGIPESTDGNLFDVVPAPWSLITKVAGDGQSVLSGLAVPIAPKVKVTDPFGNPTPGAPVHWQAGGSSGSVVTPSQTTTGADGTTEVTSWLLGDGLNDLQATLDVSQPANGPDLGDPSVLFTATGVTTLSTLNSCDPGGAKDDLTQFAFWTPGSNRTIKAVQLYLSATGAANRETPYTISLIARRGSFDPAGSDVHVATTTALLRGDNGSSNLESKLTTFTFDTPIAPIQGKQDPITYEFRVDQNPDGRTLNFNAGTCPPGTKCKVPPSCAVTEVSSTTPFPLGTEFRQSVGLIVKGF